MTLINKALLCIFVAVLIFITHEAGHVVYEGLDTSNIQHYSLGSLQGGSPPFQLYHLSSNQYNNLVTNLSNITTNENYYIGVSQDDYDELETSLVEDEKDFSRDEIDSKLQEYLDSNAELLEDVITESTYSDEVFDYSGCEYLVCTYNEAELKFSESIDSYIDDCILPELPERYRQYFDTESFKSDCEIDGWGQTLATYDGEELTGNADGKDYYIFRIN